MLQNKGMKRNPIKNPPVIPVNLLSPPDIPPNTGNPSPPIAKYNKTDSVPYFEPRQKPLNATEKVCKVNGIPLGNGIVITESTEINDVKRAVLACFFIEEYFMCFAFLC